MEELIISAKEVVELAFSASYGVKPTDVEEGRYSRHSKSS